MKTAKKINRIGIQCNGGPSIGMGHILRTMVLAEELKNECGVFYICGRDHEFETGAALIRKSGYPVFYEEEPAEADLLILDSYGVSCGTLSELRKKYGKLMYIDDLNELDHYDCDILLNRNLGAEKLTYNTAAGCRVLLGPSYALLRKEFRQCLLPEPKEQVKNILITMGGTDPCCTSVKILNMVKQLPYRFKTVVGKAYSETNAAALKKLAAENSNVELHYDPKMAELMCGCDAAVTACGGTTQELAALGIPQLAVSVGPNQNITADQSDGFFYYCGSEAGLEKESFLEKLCHILDNYEERKRMSESEKKLINRNGARLVAEEILKW